MNGDDKKIGIGITAYNRSEHLELCKNQLQKFQESKGNSVSVYIANDLVGRVGIAARKNECLKYLKDCDYIFLFDDDCFPIKENWIDFFIKAHKETGNHHFLYLKNTPSIKYISSETFLDTTVDNFNNCGGAFMFLTNEIIQKVGAFGKYGIYGAEHAGYSQRIYKAGLNKSGQYLSVRGAGEYIYAMDYDFHLPFNKKLNHYPSLRNEFHLIEAYIKEGMKFLQADINEIYKPL